MTDFLAVARHFFDWRFFSILTALLAIGLLAPERTLRPFRSIKFNAWLFLVIAVLSAVGTFIPQNKPAATTLATLGPFWTPLLETMGFTNIYHTGWFSALLALMAFDVLVCKLRRGPPRLRGSLKKDSALPQVVASASAYLSHSKLKDSFSVDTPVPLASTHLKRWLKKNRFYVEGRDVRIGDPSSGEGAHAIVAAKHRCQRWGDFILHVSIVVALAGSLLGALFGFEETLNIIEGQSVAMENRPFQVRLQNFDVEFYRASGAPSLYASDLVVTHAETGRVMAKKRIVVNHPLDIDRVRFYQASWGMTDDFHSALVRLAGRETELKPGVIVPIDRTPLAIRANQFLPSFHVDQKGRPDTSDYEGNNPALQVDFLENGVLQAQLWILQNAPGIAYQVHQGSLIPAPGPPFRLLKVDPVLFSGIQVGYDPGAPVFWTGAIALLAGLALHFYWHHRRLRLLIVPDGPRATVWVGGWSSRAKEDFERQFRSWLRDMRESMATS